MKVVESFASLKITNVLIPVIIAELVIFSLIPAPEGKSWFGTMVFIFPLLLFLLNLGACTILRIIKKKSLLRLRKAGADIIHIGLIILILTGLLFPISREEAPFAVMEGDNLILAGGTELYIERLDFATYSDGRPRSWIVNVQVNGEPDKIEVNSPLRAGGLKLFLTSFTAEPVLSILRNGDPELAELRKGLEIEGIVFLLKELRKGHAGWEMLLAGPEGEITLTAGQTLGQVEVVDVILLQKADLLAVSSPLRPLMWAAFAVIGIGLVWVPVSRGKKFWKK